MSSFQTFVIYTLLFVSAFAEFELYWKSDVTVGNKDLKGRTTFLTTINTTVFDGLYYSSTAYSVGQGQATGDGIFGSAFTVANGPLVASLNFFDVSATWGGAGNPQSADVSGAASLVGVAYLALVEVDANGNALSAIRFGSLNWDVTPAKTILKAGIKYATFTGTRSDKPNFVVSVTFASADTPAQLTNGAVLCAKCFEAIINILEFPFTNAQSSLRLVTAVGTATYEAAGTISTAGDFHRLQAGTGTHAVYFDVSKYALVDIDGKKQEVTISSGGAVSGDFEGAPFVAAFQAWRTARLLTNLNAKAETDFRIINVTLPQSNNITYDPTIGMSDPAQSGASRPTPFLTLFAVLALAFAKLL